MGFCGGTSLATRTRTPEKPVALTAWVAVPMPFPRDEREGRGEVHSPAIETGENKWGKTDPRVETAASERGGNSLIQTGANEGGESPPLCRNK